MFKTNLKYIVGFLLASTIAYTASNNFPDLRVKPKATASRPTGTEGELFTDSTTHRLQYKDNSAWYNLLGPATTDTLTNKTIDADGTGNSITNIENADIKSGAAIARDKLATGTADHVLINSGAGVLISEAQLASTRGGTGVNNAGTLTYGSNNIQFTTTGATSLTLPTTGTLATLIGSENLINKTITSPIMTSGATLHFGTATNNNRLVLPTDTTTNLDALTDTAGYIAYDSTQEKVVFNNGTAWTTVGSGAGGIYSAGVNLITNNSWEASSSNWTASGGSYARNTTADHLVPPGVGSASWDASASAQTLTANTVTITSNDGLSGRNGVMSCAVKTAATDLKMQAYDGTNVLSSNATTDVVPSSSSGFVRYSVNFIFPSSGTITGRFYSQSDSVVAYIDDCYLGLAENLNTYNVSQAEFYGRIVVSGCTGGPPSWSRSNTAYGSFGTSANCSYSATGNASAPSTNLPAIKFANLPPGNYYFVARSNFNKSVTSTNSTIAYEFHDGTTGFGENAFNHYSAAGAVISASSINGFKQYTTAQSNITFEIYGKTTVTTTSTAVTIGADNSGDSNVITNDLEIEVYRYPLASQTAYKPDEVAWYVDANISGANFDLGASDQASYVEMTNASMTLTNNSGGATAQIACASGTASTGTTCSVNESNGIAFTIPKAGTYRACTNVSHYIDTAASGAAGVTFQIVETTNTSSAVVQEGKERSENRSENAAFAPLTTPLKVCGIFVFSSAGQKTLRLEYEQDVTATLTANLVLADAAAASGQRDIHWEVFPITNATPAPLLVNSVLSNSSGIERIERALISYSAGTPSTTSQSGTWISGALTDTGTGQVSIPVTSGIFSSSPTCTCSTQENAVSGSSCMITSTSTSAITIRLRDLAGVFADENFYIICMGAK